MPITSRTIWVTFQKEGVHCFPAASNDPTLATGDDYDVSFLGYPHRHIFHFKVGIEVEHNDRDIEFIQFKRWLTKLYEGAILELNSKSCEMIAEELIEVISKKYPNRKIEVSVSEDGENGCDLFYNPTINPEFAYAIENIGPVSNDDVVVIRVPDEFTDGASKDRFKDTAREVFPSNPIVILPNSGIVKLGITQPPLILRSFIKWLSR